MEEISKRLLQHVAAWLAEESSLASLVQVAFRLDAGQHRAG